MNDKVGTPSLFVNSLNNTMSVACGAGVYWVFWLVHGTMIVFLFMFGGLYKKNYRSKKSETGTQLVDKAS